MTFTGPVTMGSELQTVNVVYDTGSDWLTVDTDQCSTCHQPVFDTNLSTSFVNTTTEHNLLYGSAELDGHENTDDVYLSHPDLGLEDFSFVGIIEQEGIQTTFDGILGLSRQ